MFEAWSDASIKLTFRPDEVYRAPTDDGASIALGRYYPRGPRRFVEPVLLGHGLGSNRFNLDLDEQQSLARFLARRGFETWVLELRGRGLAGPAAECNFDDQAEHDLGTALRVVRASGADQVTWVGHSKGGLLAYAHLARHPEAPFKAIVTLGSPATFRDQPGLQRFVRAITPMLRSKQIPTARISQLAIFGAPPGPVSRYLVNQKNIAPLVLKQAMANMASDIAGGIARQLADWVVTDRFVSYDGRLDYRAMMAGVRVPLLLIAGEEDLMAPPASVIAAQSAWGGPVESKVFAGYGHADLILGREAPTEVFVPIAEFLERNSTPERRGRRD